MARFEVRTASGLGGTMVAELLKFAGTNKFGGRSAVSDSRSCSGARGLLLLGQRPCRGEAAKHLDGADQGA